MRLAITAQFSPPSCEPANRAFLRLRAMGLMARKKRRLEPRLKPHVRPSTTLAEVLEALLPDDIRSGGNGVVALATGGQ